MPLRQYISQRFLLCVRNRHYKLVHASTYKSAMTHAGNVFVPRDLELRPFDPKINGFSRLMLDHVCVKFGDPSCTDV